MRGHNGLLLQRSMSGLLLARGVEEDIGAQAGEGVDMVVVAAWWEFFRLCRVVN